MDASDPVCDGDRLTGDTVDGGGQRCDERFDVSAPIQCGQRDDIGVDGGEVAAEMCQPGGQAADRLGSAGGAFAVQVGHERRPQRRGNIGHPLLEGKWSDRRSCFTVEDPQVEEDLAGTVSGGAIVLGSSTGMHLANITRVQ